MKLFNLTILNFRGITKQILDAQGRNVNIYGENGVGKTTIEDAFLWLLFGKDSEDKKDFDLIPHKLGVIPIEQDVGVEKEPTVEGVLEHDGKKITLKKVYAEQWPKNRETKVREYTGSKVVYYVNDLEVKAGDYQKTVSNLISEDVFKLITNPHYFSETLPWQDRRATLVKIVGELDISFPDNLKTLCDNRSFDDFYTLMKQRSKEKQKKIDAMPAVINEARRNVPQVEGSAETISVKIETLKAKDLDLVAKLSNLKNDTAMNQKRRDVADCETEIVQKRATYFKGIEAENAKIKSLIEKLDTELYCKKRVKADCESSIIRTNTVLKNYEIQGAQLQKEKSIVEARVWNGETVCPTCKRDLPSEQIKAAQAEFNTDRSNRLEVIGKHGKDINADFVDNQKLIDEQEAKIAILDDEVETLEVRISNGRAMLKTADFESTEDYKTLQSKLDGLRERVKGAVANNKQEKIDALQAEIGSIDSEVKDLNAIKSQLEFKTQQEARVAELMAQEKSLNADLESAQHAIHLCEQYVKSKTKVLETAVNSKFKVVKFQLFEKQKNGEEVECCNIIYPNGSTKLSKGQKAHAGLDIIRTLSEFYGVSAPIFFDDAEGITLDLETNAQLIQLIVSKADKKLRIEVIQ